MSTRIHVAANLNPQASAAGIMEMPMVEIDHVSLWYGEKQALKDISMSVPKHRVTAYIGPSGCGKTTLLRCLNRMNDLVDGVRMSGQIRIGHAACQRCVAVAEFAGQLAQGQRKLL